MWKVSEKCMKRSLRHVLQIEADAAFAARLMQDDMHERQFQEFMNA